MFLYTLLALFAPICSAETADDIVARARATNQVNSAVQEIRLTVAKKGAARVRMVRLSSRSEEGVTKSLLEVISPSDIAGFKVLRIDHLTGADEMLLYVPYTKKVNLINSSNQHQKFVDSDLTMEDLQLRDSADGARSLHSETSEHWVIDTKMGEESSYTLVRATLTKADLVIKKLELYDAQGVVKTIEVLRTTKEGAMTLPIETLVSDRGGSTTKIEIVSHRFELTQAELPDDKFTRAYLER